MVMLHGRGATAESILTLVPALGVSDFAYLAPQAGGNSWWPQSFLAPIRSNEPGISSAMLAVEGVLERITAGGVPPERTVLLAFPRVPAWLPSTRPVMHVAMGGWWHSAEA